MDNLKTQSTLCERHRTKAKKKQQKTEIYVLLFTTVFVWCLTHIVLCCYFICLRVVYPMLPVSLDCSFLIAPSVFSNVYLLRTAFTNPLLVLYKIPTLDE
jgi:hypothetical protein